jgi:hypothetical protein
MTTSVTVCPAQRTWVRTVPCPCTVAGDPSASGAEASSSAVARGHPALERGS